MLRPSAYVRLSNLTAGAVAALCMSTAYGQAPPPADGGVAASSKLSELEKEVAEVAENAAAHDQLRKMEEQQKALMEKLDRLQQQLETPAAAKAQPADKTAAPAALVGTQAGAASAANPSSAGGERPRGFGADGQRYWH
jgi:hypothetical protein